VVCLPSSDALLPSNFSHSPHLRFHYAHIAPAGLIQLPPRATISTLISCRNIDDDSMALVTAEKRDGLLLALERFEKREKNQRNVDRKGFLFRLQKAVDNKVISRKDPAFCAVVSRLLKNDSVARRQIKRQRRRGTPPASPEAAIEDEVDESELQQSSTE
jgi:hypothetical protein